MDESNVLRLAQLVKVEAHRRRGARGQSESVRSYVRKDLDVAGFGDAKTKKGAYASQVSTKPAAKAEPKPEPKPEPTYLTGVDVSRMVPPVKIDLAERHSVDQYVGLQFSEINRWLRHNEDPDWAGPKSGDEIRKIHMDLTAIFDRADPIPQGAEVYRGLKVDPGWEVGDELDDPGYVSTTLRREVAEKFLGSAYAKRQGKPDLGTIMKIRVPAGAKLLDEYKNSGDFGETQAHEQAFLLPTGTHYKVVAVTTEDGRKVFTVEVDPTRQKPTPVVPLKVAASASQGSTGPAARGHRLVDDDPSLMKVTRRARKDDVELSADPDEDSAIVRLARLVKVDSYRRTNAAGGTSKVRSYVRKDLDSAGFGSDKTRKGAYASMQDVARESVAPKVAGSLLSVAPTSGSDDSYASVAKQAQQVAEADYSGASDAVRQALAQFNRVRASAGREASEYGADANTTAALRKAMDGFQRTVASDKPTTNAFRLPVEDTKFAKRVPGMTDDGKTVASIWSTRFNTEFPSSLGDRRRFLAAVVSAQAKQPDVDWMHPENVPDVLDRIDLDAETKRRLKARRRQPEAGFGYYEFAAPSSDEIALAGRLDWSPKKNWVEKAGGLPKYIEDIALALIRDHGMTREHAIPVAINRVKQWARGGGGVKPDTVAKAAAALAAWEKLKAKNRAKSAS